MPPKREKRRVGRIEPLVMPCRVVHGKRRIAAHLVDLSPRGARVAALDDLPKAGRRILIEVRFGTLPYTRLPGEVKWTKVARGRAAGQVSGVTFRGITGEQELALEFVLYEFRRRAAQLA